MINLKTQNKESSLTLNITIILLMFLLAGSTFFTILTILDILNLNKQIYEKRVELETKYLQGLSLKKTNLEIEQSRERLENINQIILNTDNTLNFINDIEKTAEIHNVKHIILLPNFEKPKFPSPVSIQITLNGSYVNVLKFISALDTKPYYFNIYNISFDKQTSEITANLEAKMYWQ